MRRSLLAGLALSGMVVAANAQEPRGLRCADFLHEQGGTWRSFATASIMGPDGPIDVQTGQRFSAREKSAKGELARALDGLCLQ